eukprot:gene15820-21939_t
MLLALSLCGLRKSPVFRSASQPLQKGTPQMIHLSQLTQKASVLLLVGGSTGYLDIGERVLPAALYKAIRALCAQTSTSLLEDPAVVPNVLLVTCDEEESYLKAPPSQQQPTASLME